MPMTCEFLLCSYCCFESADNNVKIFTDGRGNYHITGEISKGELIKLINRDLFQAPADGINQVNFVLDLLQNGKPI